MFYAIEYAYGRNVVNNGNRSDVVYSFTRRALRDAWVADGEPVMNNAGFRENLAARSSHIRNAQYIENGDEYGWQVIAQQRVRNNPQLSQYRDIIFYDWGDPAHFQWVANAPVSEVLSWAEQIKEDEEE